MLTLYGRIYDHRSYRETLRRVLQLQLMLNAPTPALLLLPQCMLYRLQSRWDKSHLEDIETLNSLSRGNAYRHVPAYVDLSLKDAVGC